MINIRRVRVILTQCVYLKLKLNNVAELKSIVYVQYYVEL